MRQIIAAALPALLFVAPAARGYEYWEHRYIAEPAASAAFASFDAELPLPWLDAEGGAWVRWKDGVKGGDVEVWTSADANAQGYWGTTFGHLVGIYADWILDVPTLREQTSAAKLNTLRGKEKVVFTGKLDTLIRGGFEFLRDAAVNESHFSSIAVYTYVDHHHRAIKLAYDAAWKKKAGRITEAAADLTEAVHYEALGCHSLTDLFAPGHLMEDRQQAIAWELGGERTVLKGIIRGGGVDKDTHDKFNQLGLVVRSFDAYASDQDSSWLARGDGCLSQAGPDYKCGKNYEAQTKKLNRPQKYSPQNPDGLSMARRAVARSVVKLLTAYQEFLAGKTWEEVNLSFDYYSALTFVPVQYQRAYWVKVFGSDPDGCSDTWCSFPHLKAIEDIRSR
jgi:hypothetical protein